MDKKGNSKVVAQAPHFIVLLILIGFALALGQTILGSNAATACTDAGGFFNASGNTCMNDTNTSNALADPGYAFNTTQDGRTGLDTFSSWQNTMALVGVITLILAMVIGILAVFRRRQ